MQTLGSIINELNSTGIWYEINFLEEAKKAITILIKENLEERVNDFPLSDQLAEVNKRLFVLKLAKDFYPVRHPIPRGGYGNED